MNDRNKSDGVTLGMNQDHFSVEDRASGAHPGTEQCSVRGRLMLRMVSGMFRRLRLRQPADSQYTEHQDNGEELAERVVH
jgi:hypothetical protein